MRKNIVASWRVVAALAGITLCVTGCGGGSTQDASTATTTAPGTTGSTQPTALSVTGSPASSAVVGTPYSFSPSVNAPTGSTLTYSIQNKPAWASFDSGSGTLSGTPDAASVGTYSNIVISASNGSASASLSAFSITVTEVTSGTATVSWSIPTTNSDGSPLKDLAGFKVYYGTSASSLTQVVQLTNSTLLTYVITNLPAGTWYFGVKSYTSAGTESSISNIGSKTIS